MPNAQNFKVGDRVRIKYPDRYFKEFRQKWNGRTGTITMQSSLFSDSHCRINIDPTGKKKAIKYYFIGFEDLEKLS